MSCVTSADTLDAWPKDSQRYKIYTNEEGIYELLILSQQSSKSLQEGLLHCVVSSCSTANYK